MRSPLRHMALIVGLVLGLSAGLVYTWYLFPVELVNTYPALLDDVYRRDWIRMTALSYVADGDMARAQERLSGFSEEEVARTMGDLITAYAEAGQPAETMRRLTELAQALNVHTPAMLVYLQTPVPSAPTPSPSATPTPTVVTAAPSTTPLPTKKPTRTPRPPTPTPTPVPPFQLADQEQVCQPDLRPHIAVVVQDEDGEALAGVEVWLMWDGGADRAVTGLKPEQGTGYADFDADPEVAYALGTSELGIPLITDLRIEPCPQEKGKETITGSWRIVLQRRPSEPTATNTPQAVEGEETATPPSSP